MLANFKKHEYFSKMVYSKELGVFVLMIKLFLFHGYSISSNDPDHLNFFFDHIKRNPKRS